MRQGSAPRERITSAANAQIKRIRALRERKERAQTELFFVEGIRAVAAALDAGFDVQHLIVAPELLESDFARQTVRAAERGGTPVLEVSPAVFETISRKDGPQGIALVARQRWLDLPSLALGSTGVCVALVEPQDPGNLGSILRTCDAVGAAGLILVGSSADPYDPSALRASTGAAFTVPLVRTSWGELSAWARQGGVHMVGASGGAPTSYRSATYRTPLVLLMGSEREGLSEPQQTACDTLVHIPMRGTVDSLNLAVATSLVLYDVFERRLP
jgi:TrmH family RNA methyltransferase